ncbi:MAG: hypothetical protein MUO18_05725, partial [Methanomassiliicoccales archaeon]|nr:hypothetical protein [Methanomassiliicoccales archaeon]
KMIPDSLPEDPILPYRRKNGEFDKAKGMNSDLFSVQWERFERKHILNRLRPVDIRHWVASTCRKAELSLAARCALQGHKFKSSNQNENYDNPQDVEIIEEQSRAIPYGPIGFVCPRMEVTQALPSELTDALSNCLIGEMLPSQLSEMVIAYMTRQIKKPVSNLVA